jgi:hypothetical protein
MGREIKRVPLDFDWPLEQIWEGYNPPEQGTQPCRDCADHRGHATGYSALGRRFYGMKEKILPHLMQDLTPEELRFWTALEKKQAPEYRRARKNRVPYGSFTGDMDQGFATYDLMKFLAKSLNVSYEKTFVCQTCKGKAEVVADESVNSRAKRWRRREPPKGKGWQVWETVSEGSPITPVFATADELIEHLCTVGTTWDQKSIAQGWQKGLPTREQATAFVKGSGWVPSAVITVGDDGSATMHKNIEAAPLLRGAAT